MPENKKTAMPVWLDEEEPAFPSANLAAEEPDGLLCIGGNLNISTLLQAYSLGIFPWYSAEQPILWWSPDPRMVLFPEKLHVSSSMKKWLRKTTLTVTWNTCFSEVVKQCAANRKDGTWITDDMIQAYQNLHQAGYAASLEVWDKDTLAGGLYGPVTGQVFFGESMFSRVPNASKMALIHLVRSSLFKMIDCQFHTPHLERMGATLIARKEYLGYLTQFTNTLGSTIPENTTPFSPS